MYMFWRKSRNTVINQWIRFLIFIRCHLHWQGLFWGRVPFKVITAKCFQSFSGMLLHAAIMLNVAALICSCLHQVTDDASPTLLVLFLASSCVLGEEEEEEEGVWCLAVRGFSFPETSAMPQAHFRSRVPLFRRTAVKSNWALVCPMCLASCGCCCPFKWVRLTPQEQRVGRIR